MSSDSSEDEARLREPQPTTSTNRNREADIGTAATLLNIDTSAGLDSGTAPQSGSREIPSAELAAPVAEAIEKLSQEPTRRRPERPLTAAAPGVVVDATAQRQQAIRAALPAVAVALGGCGLLLLGVARGISPFLGTADIFTLIIDAIGLAAIATACLRLAFVLSRRVGRRDLRVVGAATLVLSYGLALLINRALASPLPPPSRDQPTSTTVAASAHATEARRFLANGNNRFARRQPAAARELVNAIYAAGATTVEVVDPSTVGPSQVGHRLTIHAPETAQSAIVEAMLAHLGVAAQEVDPRSLEPPAQGPWIVPVGYDY